MWDNLSKVNGAIQKKVDKEQRQQNSNGYGIMHIYMQKKSKMDKKKKIVRAERWWCAGTAWSRVNASNNDSDAQARKYRQIMAKSSHMSCQLSHWNVPLLLSSSSSFAHYCGTSSNRARIWNRTKGNNNNINQSRKKRFYLWTFSSSLICSVLVKLQFPSSSQLLPTSTIRIRFLNLSHTTEEMVRQWLCRVRARALIYLG